MRGKWMLLGVVLLWGLAAPALALDAGRVKDIRRASTAGELAELAEKYMREDASRKPLDFEEGTQIAAEMGAYLLYIQIRQNELLMQRLGPVAAPQP